jgi:uncharacterized membrane protein YfhO
VISELFYPGWNAYVDGNKQNILKANGIFRAVQVPSGKHTITFKYESTAIRIGVFISLLTVFIFCLMLLRSILMKRTEQLVILNDKTPQPNKVAQISV